MIKNKQIQNSLLHFINLSLVFPINSKWGRLLFVVLTSLINRFTNTAITAIMIEIIQSSLPPPAYGGIAKQNSERFSSSQSRNCRTKNLLRQQLLDPT